MAKKKKMRGFKGKVGRNTEKQNRGSQFGHLNLPKGLNVFKEEPGSRIKLDIIPYQVTSKVHLDRDEEYEIAVPGTLWYKHPYYLHRNIGANNESVVCPKSMNQTCPICEYRSQLMKEGAKWDDDTVKALKPSMRNLYVVIPKDNKKYDEVPHIWDISQFLFQEKLNEEIQEDERYETFPDLEEGYTLRIRFSEEQLGSNKFADTSRIDFIEREKGYDEDILEDVPNLDEILIIPSTKAIEALFFGGLTEEEAEAEAEEEVYDDEEIEDEVGDKDFDEDEEDFDEELEMLETTDETNETDEIEEVEVLEEEESKDDQ